MHNTIRLLAVLVAGGGMLVVFAIPVRDSDYGHNTQNIVPTVTLDFGSPPASEGRNDNNLQDTTDEQPRDPIDTRSDPVSTPTLTPRTIDNDVPFTPQAPTANWDNPIYQDGCEEASVLMAARWLQQQPITPQDALQEIQALSQQALQLFGTAIDASARDTATLLQTYRPDADVHVEEGVTIDDMVATIRAGNIIITPTNGRLLNNPHFTPPGPIRHMVVVRGYDATAHQFITNDPGTRHGDAYRYDPELLYNAMQDYGTGNHTNIIPNKKIMIVVERQPNPPLF